MTPEQIIQRVRALESLRRGGHIERAMFFEQNGILDMADAAVELADAYDAQALKLAEVEAERDHERHEKETVFDASHAMIRYLRAERDALKAKVAQVVSQLTAIGTEPPTSGQMVTPRWSLIQPGVRQELLHLAAFLKGDQ